MSAALLLLALLLQARGPGDTPASGRDGAPEPRGAISGRILCAQTGEPVKGASVQAEGSDQDHSWRQAALSSADGSFSFERLPSGAYSLFLEKAGYQPYYSREPISLDRNQRRSGIEIKLNRAVAITGRVTDADGLPVVGSEVAAYLFVWSNGRRRLNRSEDAHTDDRGVYRLFGLPAGRYLIGASASNQELPQGEVDLRLASLFYPAAARPSEAAALEARWGQDLSEINFVLRPQPTYAVSGVVADAATGGPCRSCIVRAITMEEDYTFSDHRAAITPDGSFRVRGLLPGSYRVRAEKMDRPGHHAVSSRTVQITNRNLRDVNLLAGAGHTVAGRVVLESPPADFGKVDIPIFLTADGPGERLPVKSDLSFEATGLAAETYRLLVPRLPQGAYLKALRVAGRDLPRPEIEVPEDGDVAQLELVLAFDSPTLAGRVKPPDSAGSGHRVTAATIVLFPQENQSGFVVQRRAGADPSGSFTVTGIAPGAYTVFAFPPSPTSEWEDPEVRRRLQSYGKSIDLGAGKQEAVELSLAPLAAEPQ